jgi:hypothetical protein
MHVTAAWFHKTPPSSLTSPIFLVTDFFTQTSRQGLTRQANRSPNPQQQSERGHIQQQTSSPTFTQHMATSASPVPPSPGLPPDMSFPNQQPPNQQNTSRRPAYFFREEYSGLIVKGNFMTLAAKPVHVEEGEWLAHQGMHNHLVIYLSLIEIQVVEQYRILESMINIIRVEDEKNGLPICNSQVCPTMSASA